MELQQRVAALGPKIEKLMSISNTAGLSLGVLHQGSPIHHANYGFLDIAKKLPMTEETIFPPCLLTKTLIAAAIGILVDEGHVKWDTPVADILPDFKRNDNVLRGGTTIADLLSHRTGKAAGDDALHGTNDNTLTLGDDGVEYVNSQERLQAFRRQLQHNILGYELATHAIENLTGLLWTEFVQIRILDVLDMQRTYLKTPPCDLENVAKCYNSIDDATSTPNTSSEIGDGLFGVASGGMHTCVDDLMKLYSAFLTGLKAPFGRYSTSANSSPLEQGSHSMSAQIPIDQPIRSGTVLFNHGSLPGALASVILVPDTESAIIILSNSLTLNDTTDQIGELVLEEVLDAPGEDRNDSIGATKLSVAECAKRYPTILSEPHKEQNQGTLQRDLDEYVGAYRDEIHSFTIKVTVEQGILQWTLHGFEPEKLPLTHHANDVFVWLWARDEEAERDPFVDNDTEVWKIEFKANADGRIDRLTWEHDIVAPTGEFVKRDVEEMQSRSTTFLRN